MAVQASVKRNLDEAFKMRQQLQEEASKLLSFQTLGTRMSQLDSIIKRRADKVFFSMETDQKQDGHHAKLAESNARQEKIVRELLLKVKKRKKMIRSYTYLSWFCIFFGCFLGNLSLKEDNAHLFAVDLSIQNRIVDILPKGVLGGNSDFYKWFESVVSDVYEEAICGNGVCEMPEEYPGYGRFGCVSDCGRYLPVTPVRIDTTTAWATSPGGYDFSGFAVGTADTLNISFTYNIYSSTMDEYILARDSARPSTVIDLPDGYHRLEIYQPTLISLDVPAGDLSEYASVAPSTMMKPNKSFDFQYGDPAEAIATTASLNRQLLQFCSGGTSCPVPYSSRAMAPLLRNMYGLRGNVSIVLGSGVRPLVTFPFCSLTPPANDKVDANILDPKFCSDGSQSPFGAADRCYSAKKIAQGFQCKGSYPFEIWSYGPPRNVTVKPENITKKRTLTPFNNLIGGIVITQFRRREASCPIKNAQSIDFLTGQFSCQARARGEAPFSIDPTFQATSSLYNGKLAARDYFAENEIQSSNNSDGAVHLKMYPYGFFPHQWDAGGIKEAKYISPENLGLYKLFFDSQLSTAQAKRLLQYMKDAFFVDAMTDQIEIEIITFNAEFNVFGIMTIQFKWDQGGAILWEYQYNTAQLSPYAGAKGTMTLMLEVIFGLMLVVDIVRESRDIYFAILRENVFNGYITKFWNWIDWTHYATMITSIGLWINYNMYISSMGLKAGYPVLKNPNAKCRLFATDPRNEFEFIDFTLKMRNLADMKNLCTAINCISILLFVVRILKILDFQPRMSLITRTLRMASTDLGHYLSLFSIIFVGYASVGTLLLGDRLQQFQTFGDSCSVLFMIFMGWEPMYRVMSQAASETKIAATVVVFQFFYWSWVLIAAFIMLNIVLAIIVEAYANVKAEMKDAPTIIHESLTVCQEAIHMIGNRICGSQWFISDSELEKVLIKQNRSFQSRKKLLDTITQIRGKVKSVRLAGGLEVTEKDFASLLDGFQSDTKSLLSRVKKALVKEDKDSPENLTVEEDGVEVVNEELLRPPPAIENLIKRYGEVVPDGKDDEELLDLIRTENVKRQMAMYTSQDQIRQQVDIVVNTLNSIARITLPPEELERLETEVLVKRNADGSLSLDVGDILTKASKLDGTLNVTVVAAKRLPRLDIFSESDPYCVLILEEPAESETEGTQQEFLARTETKKNESNPLWNSEHCFDLTCSSGTKIIAAVLDRDEHGTDDLIGTFAIVVSDLPLGKEIDKWYYLKNDAAPHLAKKAMLRLKLMFSANITTDGIDSSELKRSTSERGCARRSSAVSIRGGESKDELKDDLKWLQDKLSIVARECENLGGNESMTKLLEVTVVSARHLPKRDAFFMKLDPYIKISFNGVEYESVVKYNTYSPDWEQSFVFHIPQTSELSDGIRLVMMDWDRFTDHDTVGFAEISVDKTMDILSQDPGVRHEQTLNLQRKGKTVMGHDGIRTQVTLAFRVKNEGLNSPNVRPLLQHPDLKPLGLDNANDKRETDNLDCVTYNIPENVAPDLRVNNPRRGKGSGCRKHADTVRVEGTEAIVAADVGYEGTDGFYKKFGCARNGSSEVYESCNDMFVDATDGELDVEVAMSAVPLPVTNAVVVVNVAPA